MRKRWITDVEHDLRGISIQGWRLKTKDWQVWRRVVQRPSPQWTIALGCCCCC